MNYSMFTRSTAATDKSNLLMAINMVKDNLMSVAKNYEVYNIIGFGRVIAGDAFYHEMDQSYKCIGIEVEIESKLDLKKEGYPVLKGDLKREIGFFSIWKGKSSTHAPFTFEIGYSDKLGKSLKFENGIGDHITVKAEVFPLEIVQSLVKEHGLL